MNKKDPSCARQDVVATTGSYGGPKDTADTADGTPADSDSDPAKTGDVDADWTDEGGATPQGPATDGTAPGQGDHVVAEPFGMGLRHDVHLSSQDQILAGSVVNQTLGSPFDLGSG